MSIPYHHYDLGVVGNCAFLSYIDSKAGVQWQCWPYFDSSFIFGGLLDDEKGGEFRITPKCPNAKSRQSYIDNTNILETHFICDDGEFKVVDFAPRFELYERFHKPLMLFRKIRRIKGNPQIQVVCDPRGRYGELQGRPVIGSNSINFQGLDSEVRLTTNISKVHILHKNHFALTENKYLVLSYGAPFEAPLNSTFEEFLYRTKQYWRKWIERSTIPPLFQKDVIRSSLVLKLHQFEDTGAIIASGTTSLPEYPGNQRNWDYRYCWVRDSYFTLSALNSLSHFAEAEAYSQYIQNIAEKDNHRYRPVYRIDCNDEIPESLLDLKGYQGYGPVRVGNLAYEQIQNDVYGQIILTLLPLYIDERIYSTQSRPPLSLIEKMLGKIESCMEEPDAGIWEYRNKKQHHCETYLFHWAGCKAALKIASRYQCDSIRTKASKLLKEATANIEQCFDSERQVYTMAQENKALDASNLLLVTMNYLSKDNPNIQKHLEHHYQQLHAGEGLFYRYRDLDDFGETHSTFTVCSFWYCEALAAAGHIQKAREMFEKLLSYSNPLGIFSEDIEPNSKGQWGNFAQTYSHVGLINTAFKLNKLIDLPLFEDFS